MSGFRFGREKTNNKLHMKHNELRGRKRIPIRCNCSVCEGNDDDGNSSICGSELCNTFFREKALNGMWRMFSRVQFPVCLENH